MRILLTLLLLVSFPVWATDISAGTDLSTVLNSSGSYTLLVGTHTASTFTIAANVTLTAEEGATLVIPSGVVLEYRDNFTMTGLRVLMETGAQLKTEAESGDAFVDTALISGNSFVSSGAIVTPPRVYVSQGFANYHRNIKIKNNNFWSVILLEEVGDNNEFSGNFFYEMEGLRPIQWWGSNHRIERNYVSGGIFGIAALGKHNIGANRRPCTGNHINSNIVLDTSEEGISFDVVGNVAAETVIREYDTVATTPGSSVITLASANWAAQTTYTGSKYDVVFVSGTLAGKRYTITTHSGASFTLSGVSADYASINVGDGVSVQLSCYGNTVSNNLVIPTLIEGRTYSSGIVLHGTGTENVVANNIAFGVTDGTGPFDNYAIREANLNGVTATDAITYDGTNSTTIAATQRRAPVGLNTITNNRSLGGGAGVDYINYSSAADYTPIGSTYVDMVETPKSIIGFSGGDLPSTILGYKLKPSSPLCGAGYPSLAKYDYEGKRFGNPPNIGAFSSCGRNSITTRSTYDIR